MATYIEIPLASDEAIKAAVNSLKHEPYYAPGRSKLLTKAEQLYRDGAIHLDADGKFFVESSDDQTTCHVGEACDCPHGQKRKESWCCHRIGVELFHLLHAEELMQEDQGATAEKQQPREVKTEKLTMSQAAAVKEDPSEPLHANGASAPAGAAEMAWQLKRLIVSRFYELGCKPVTKADFDDLALTMVGLPLTPEHFAVIAERLQTILEDRAALPPPPKALLTPETLPEDMVQKVHDKIHIKFIGLLAMAHQRGLTELSAEFISVTPELALAKAHAFFADGRRFYEAADATERNILAPAVKQHFPRMALTRAKARCLRDALNIADASAEEME